jgi:hypothetical protein
MNSNPERRTTMRIVGDAKARKEYMAKGAYMRPVLSPGSETTKMP